MCRLKERDDHREFTRLLARWEEPIRRLCTRMLGDAERAEDLKQEIFLRLFESRKSYQPKSRFSTFLWRIALNRCYDELRRQRRRREFLDPDLEAISEQELGRSTDEAGPDTQTAALEEGELVRRAVIGLPEIYRAVIVLRHYEGLKLARIAELLEIPEGTVNSRMAEALDRLSQILGPKLKGEPLRTEANVKVPREQGKSAAPPPASSTSVAQAASAPFKALARQLCE